jgi:hypothetical protein
LQVQTLKPVRSGFASTVQPFLSQGCKYSP